MLVEELICTEKLTGLSCDPNVYDRGKKSRLKDLS
jgi:hypothetical protein